MSSTHTAHRNRWRALAVGSATAMTITMLGSAPALADDGGGGEAGKPVSKSMSQSGQETIEVKGYVNENEHAFIQMMKFYVPMQAANGTVEFS